MAADPGAGLSSLPSLYPRPAPTAPTASARHTEPPAGTSRAAGLPTGAGWVAWRCRPRPGAPRSSRLKPTWEAGDRGTKKPSPNRGPSPPIAEARLNLWAFRLHRTACLLCADTRGPGRSLPATQAGLMDTPDTAHAPPTLLVPSPACSDPCPLLPAPRHPFSKLDPVLPPEPYCFLLSSPGKRGADQTSGTCAQGPPARLPVRSPNPVPAALR